MEGEAADFIVFYNLKDNISMNKMVHIMRERLKNIDKSALIAAIYAGIVWFSYLYLNFAPEKPVYIMAIGMTVISYCIIRRIMNWIRKHAGIRKRNGRICRKEKIIVYLVTAGIAFAILLVWFLAYYPGSFSTDSITQYGQAVKGNYSDWHPVWHTLIFFTFPLKVFGRTEAIILLQIFYFSLIMGYFSLTIYEMTNLKITILASMYILANPYTGHIMMYPWKDVGFAMAAFLCTIFSIRLIINKESTAKTWKLVLFGLALASATIFRHNAILYTASLLFILFFQTDRKNWIKILVFTTIILLVIKVPVYHALDVEKPDKRVRESMGLPLTVIGNVAKETPERMDAELWDFAFSMASYEQWSEYYVCGNFNNIKWNGIDFSGVEEEGYSGMLRLMGKCFKLSPVVSTKAFIALTDMVYGFENGLEGNVGYGIITNDYGITNKEMLGGVCRTITDDYSEFINNTIFKYLRTYGVCLLVMLVVALSRVDFKSIGTWRRPLMVVPIFAYDFGTMLLLTGPDSRFFFITFLVTPLLVVWNAIEK